MGNKGTLRSVSQSQRNPDESQTKNKTAMNFRPRDKTLINSFQNKSEEELNEEISIGKSTKTPKSRKTTPSRGIRVEHQIGNIVNLSVGRRTPSKGMLLSHDSNSTRANSVNPRRAPTSGKRRSGHSLSIKKVQEMFNKKNEENMERESMFVKKTWKGKTVFTNKKNQTKLTINGETPILLDPITVRKSNSENSNLNQFYYF